MDVFIHDTAVIRNTNYGSIKVFRGAAFRDSNIGDGVSIGDDTTIERCVIGNHVAINRRSYLNDSSIGDYSYTGINTTMNFTRIGKFCSLARNVDIGGIDHDYHKVTTMPAFRFYQTQNGGGKIPVVPKHQEYCTIGNDVWIAAGANVLHSVTIGDGAVIGAGAVVTRDVPPYAIVAGVPAKIIGYRCSEAQIRALEEIRWWDWPETVLKEVVPQLTQRDISDESIAYLKQIASSMIDRQE